MVGVEHRHLRRRGRGGQRDQAPADRHARRRAQRRGEHDRLHRHSPLLEGAGNWSSRAAAQPRPRASRKRARKSVPALSSSNRSISALRGGIRGAAQARARSRPSARSNSRLPRARLEVIIALGRRPRDQLDLALVEPEPLIGRARLRLDRAVVGKEDALRAAFDDRRARCCCGDVGERLGREDDRDILLAQAPSAIRGCARRTRDCRGTARLRRGAAGSAGRRTAPRAGGTDRTAPAATAPGWPIRVSVSKQWTSASASRSSAASSKRAERPFERVGLKRRLERVGLQQQRKAGQRALVAAARRRGSEAPTRARP